MDKETFWKVIDDVNAQVDCNDQNAVLEATRKRLMEFSSDEIVQWHQIKRAYMDLAYRNDLWAACTATESHNTNDGFIDFRSWLISRGQTVYRNALNDPDSLADLDMEAGTADFELYGYVAYDAYAQKKALESEDLASILHKCCAWTAEHASKVFEMCEFYSVPVEEKYSRLTDAYFHALSQEYDIVEAVKNQPLSEDLPKPFARRLLPDRILAPIFLTTIFLTLSRGFLKNTLATRNGDPYSYCSLVGVAVALCARINARNLVDGRYRCEFL